jgi:hypothetical protein
MVFFHFPSQCFSSGERVILSNLGISGVLIANYQNKYITDQESPTRFFSIQKVIENELNPANQN